MLHVLNKTPFVYKRQFGFVVLKRDDDVFTQAHITDDFVNLFNEIGFCQPIPFSCITSKDKIYVFPSRQTFVKVTIGSDGLLGDYRLDTRTSAAKTAIEMARKGMHVIAHTQGGNKYKLVFDEKKPCLLGVKHATPELSQLNNETTNIWYTDNEREALDFLIR